jgi:flagellar biosynthesis/type III secretory pathway M-ring protein FliF/YscJ
MRNRKLQENTSTYISTIAMIIASTAVLVSIHTWRRAKRYKIIFKKLKNGRAEPSKEILLLQKLRKPAQNNACLLYFAT